VSARRRGDATVLAQYLREIHRIPQLSRAEEARFARRAAQGDAGARDRLIGANLRFVIMIARRYMHLGMSMEDLVSEGNMGLIRAIRSYDPGRGVRFISYAVWWIRQAILHALKENPAAASLDAPVGGSEGESTLADLLADEETRGPEDTVVEELLCGDVRALLERLPPREMEILRQRYGLGGRKPASLEEIGVRLHMTRERIRQIEKRALRRIRCTAASRRLRSSAEV
jgi:RNA polymerase primary sigma factor